MTDTTTERRLLAPSFGLNDRLGKGRETAGVTQDRMAELLGCSRRTISRYERPGVKVPPAVVLAYHVACEIDLAWLASGTPSWEGGEQPWYSSERFARPEGLEPPTFCSVADLDREAAFWAIVEPAHV